MPINVLTFTYDVLEPSEFRAKFDDGTQLDMRDCFYGSEGFQAIWLIISMASSVGTSMLATFLYEKIHRQPDIRLYVGKKLIAIDRESIEKALNEAEDVTLSQDEIHKIIRKAVDETKSK